MKLRGQEIKLDNVVDVEIRPGLELKVTALPLGFETQASRIFPAPPCPQKYAEGPGGKLMRDPMTKKPFTVDDRTDQKWLVKHETAQRNQMMFIIWKALCGEDIEWEFTKNHSDPENPEFCAAMFDELREQGFTTGDLTKLMEATLEASQLDGDEVDEERDGF